MKIRTSPSGQQSEKWGGKYIPALCNFLGTLILLAIIVTFLPLSVPRALGFNIYNVVNGSMEPEIPVGSVIYVKYVEPATIAEGEIIAFHSEDSVVTHRVVKNRPLESELVTNGDSNPDEDQDVVSYSEVIGRVIHHYPVIGRLLALYTSKVGKIYVLIFAACGVMFHLLAHRMRDRKREMQLQQETAASMLRSKKETSTVAATVSLRRQKKRRRRFYPAIRISSRQAGWLRRGLMLLLLGIFLFSAGGVFTIQHQYREGDELYESIADEYTLTLEESSEASSEEDSSSVETTAPGTETSEESSVKQEISSVSSVEETDAPLRVNFDALLAANKDVVGWIYCKNTVINYPVLQAQDDDYYLHRDFNRNYSVFGSIFQEARNRPGFQDANNILYGHHMRNGSMFASLEMWSKQSYYDKHPHMWLLTPNGDYRIDLIAGYTTKDTSDTYTVFSKNDVEFSAYLREKVALSNFRSHVTVDPEARYVVLSTCAYVFDNARYVLHGMLVPVASIGGVPIE